MNFSKHPDKYIKYTWQTLEDMIHTEFFEGRLKQKTRLENALKVLKLST